jgi:hypothetical protein
VWSFFCKRVANFVLLSVAIGMTACGGDGHSAGRRESQVATVGGAQISKASFDHWMAILTAKENLTSGPPTVPVPPRYERCMAQLLSEWESAGAHGAKPTSNLLRKRCALIYVSLRQGALGSLIEMMWVAGEARELGVRVSPGEVERSLESARAGRSSAQSGGGEIPGAGREYGEAASDEALRAREILQLTGIQKIQTDEAHKLLLAREADIPSAQVASYYRAHRGRYRQKTAGSGQRPLAQVEQRVRHDLAASAEQSVLAQVERSFERRWIARTDCMPGFIVLQCRQSTRHAE